MQSEKQFLESFSETVKAAVGAEVRRIVSRHIEEAKREIDSKLNEIAARYAIEAGSRVVLERGDLRRSLQVTLNIKGIGGA